MREVIGFVVPTLGTRVTELDQCIQSIERNGVLDICVVTPAKFVRDIAMRYPRIHVIEDPCRGLAAAINTGVEMLPSTVTSFNWLGDDDQLTIDGLLELSDALARESNAVLAYGMCEYVTRRSDSIFVNRSAKWSEALMHFGPQLVSQPALLIRRASFESVNGLDESLSHAFDLDLLLKLRRVGRFVRVPVVAARYCWHDGALTVASRRESVSEASKVRKRHLPRGLRYIAPFWELFITRMILVAGHAVSFAAARKSRW